MRTGPLYWRGGKFPSRDGLPVAISQAQFNVCCCGIEDFCALSESASGGMEGFEKTYSTNTFATHSGRINVFLTHYGVPDWTKIYIDDVLVHDTGCTGGSWNLTFTVAAAPVHTLKMRINLDGCQNPGTAWYFSITCDYD